MRKSGIDDEQHYKLGSEILGVSLDDLDEFINPDKAQANTASHISNQKKMHDTGIFLDRIDKAMELPENLNNDIDHICNYCMKLINELNGNGGDSQLLI